jgi:transposase
MKKRKEYVTNISAYIREGYMEIYIDECSFNLSMRKTYGWGKKNKDMKFPTLTKSENVTLLAAVCKWGLLAFCLFVGSVKGNDLAFFLGHLVQILENKKYFEKYVLIFDNAPIHYGGDFKNGLFAHINILRLAPYSPFLNPIEEVFALWKKNVKDCDYKSIDELIYRISVCGHELRASYFSRICQHAYSYFEPSYFMEKIE